MTVKGIYIYPRYLYSHKFDGTGAPHRSLVRVPEEGCPVAGGGVESQQPGVEGKLGLEQLQHPLLETAHCVLSPRVHVALHGARPARVLGEHL